LRGQTRPIRIIKSSKFKPCSGLIFFGPYWSIIKALGAKHNFLKDQTWPIRMRKSPIKYCVQTLLRFNFVTRGLFQRVLKPISALDSLRLLNPFKIIVSFWLGFIPIFSSLYIQNSEPSGIALSYDFFAFLAFPAKLVVKRS